MEEEEEEEKGEYRVDGDECSTKQEKKKTQKEKN